MHRFCLILFVANLALAITALPCTLWLGHAALLIALAHLSVAALLLAPLAARQRLTLFDPLTLILAYLAIGAVLPAYLIAFHDSPRLRFILNGQPPEAFVEGALWYLLGTFLIGLGYGACRTRVAVERWMPKDSAITAQGVLRASVIGGALSLLAALWFVQTTGGLEALSVKRSVQIETGAGVVHSSASYLRMLGDLAFLLLLTGLSFFLRKDTRPPWLVFTALTLIAALIPFLASSRESIVFLLLGLVIVLGCYGRLSGRGIVVFAGTALVLFSLMTGLRSLSQGGAERLEAPNALIALGESGNGLSLIGTSHILSGVPEKMPYRLGATYLSWISAPVPRRLWPEKPDISLGKEIREVIIGQPVIRSGRPPSILSEGWINFGPVGFVITGFFFGYVLRLLALSFAPVMTRNIFLPPLYITLLFALTSLANAALSQALVRAGTDLVLLGTVIVLLRLCSAPQAQPGTTPPWRARIMFRHRADCRIASRLIEARLASAAPRAPWTGIKLRLPAMFSAKAPAVIAPNRPWRPATIKNAEAGTDSAPKIWAAPSTASTGPPWANSAPKT
jgi:hypothetical protein